MSLYRGAAYISSDDDDCEVIDANHLSAPIYSPMGSDGENSFDDPPPSLHVIPQAAPNLLRSNTTSSNNYPHNDTMGQMMRDSSLRQHAQAFGKEPHAFFNNKEWLMAVPYSGVAPHSELPPAFHDNAHKKRAMGEDEAQRMRSRKRAPVTQSGRSNKDPRLSSYNSSSDEEEREGEEEEREGEEEEEEEEEKKEEREHVSEIEGVQQNREKRRASLRLLNVESAIVLTATIVQYIDRYKEMLSMMNPVPPASLDRDLVRTALAHQDDYQTVSESCMLLNMYTALYLGAKQSGDTEMSFEFLQKARQTAGGLFDQSNYDVAEGLNALGFAALGDGDEEKGAYYLTQARSICKWVGATNSPVYLRLLWWFSQLARTAEERLELLEEFKRVRLLTPFKTEAASAPVLVPHKTQEYLAHLNRITMSCITLFQLDMGGELPLLNGSKVKSRDINIRILSILKTMDDELYALQQVSHTAMNSTMYLLLAQLLHALRAEACWRLGLKTSALEWTDHFLTNTQTASWRFGITQAILPFCKYVADILLEAAQFDKLRHLLASMEHMCKHNRLLAVFCEEMQAKIAAIIVGGNGALSRQRLPPEASTVKHLHQQAHLLDNTIPTMQKGTPALPLRGLEAMDDLLANLTYISLNDNDGSNNTGAPFHTGFTDPFTSQNYDTPIAASEQYPLHMRLFPQNYGPDAHAQAYPELHSTLLYPQQAQQAQYPQQAQQPQYPQQSQQSPTNFNPQLQPPQQPQYLQQSQQSPTNFNPQLERAMSYEPPASPREVPTLMRNRASAGETRTSSGSSAAFNPSAKPVRPTTTTTRSNNVTSWNTSNSNVDKPRNSNSQKYKHSGERRPSSKSFTSASTTTTTPPATLAPSMMATGQPQQQDNSSATNKKQLLHWYSWDNQKGGGGGGFQREAQPQNRRRSSGQAKAKSARHAHEPMPP